MTYEFGPDGAQFSPGVTLTITLDPAYLPVGVALENLRIGQYEGGTWAILDSVVDPEAMTIKATLSHFSVYGVVDTAVRAPVPEPVSEIAPPTPAVTGSPTETATERVEEPPAAAIEPAMVAAVDEPPVDSVPAFRMSLLATVLGVAGILIALTAALVVLQRRKLLGDGSRLAFQTISVNRPVPVSFPVAAGGVRIGRVFDTHPAESPNVVARVGSSTMPSVPSVTAPGGNDEDAIDNVMSRLRELGRLSFGEPDQRDATRLVSPQ
jgi:hypothetical protein